MTGLVAGGLMVGTLPGVASAAPAVDKVTGGGTVDALYRGFDAQLSFTAQKDAAGNVKGKADLSLPGEGFKVAHVDVDCLVVIGNTAYIGGIITDSDIPTEIGRSALWAVLDGGKDDMTTQLFAGPEGACANPDAQGELNGRMQAWTHGQVRVH